jgi:hypothetical protein
MTSEESQCPDCGGTVTEIRLIDKAHGGGHHDLEYTLEEAKRGLWLGRFPIEGRVAASMCGQCGRIFLYGIPTAS